MILIVHEGNQLYFRASLSLNKRYNNVAFINSSVDNVQFEDHFHFIKDRYALFESSYVHMSTNPEWIEKLCFRRYFLALAYMRINSLDSIWLLDSDVVTFRNLDDVAKVLQLSQYDAALSIPGGTDGPEGWAASPHCSWWTLTSLTNFVDFIEVAYRDKQGALREKFEQHCKQDGSGGVCDMTLLHLWATERKVLNTVTPINTAGFLIDHNVNCSTDYKAIEFLSHLGLKRFHARGGKPVAKSIAQVEFPVAAIHFQGDSKIAIILTYLFYPKIAFLLIPHIVRLARKLRSIAVKFF